MRRKKNIDGLSEEKVQEILASVPMTEKSYKDMSLQIADHQFIVRLLNTWHAATKEDLRKFMKQVYLQDNKNLVNSVVTSVSKQLGEAMAPILLSLAELKDDVKEINNKITCIDTKVTAHEGKIKDLEGKVGQIEIDVEQLKKDVEALKEDKEAA